MAQNSAPLSSAGRRSLARTAVVWDAVQGVLEPLTDATVLDIGGGTGGLAVRVAELGHQVTVVDPNPDALAILGRRAEESGVADRVTAVQGDLAGLHHLVAADSVDVVLCHGVLMYVPEPDPLLAGLARMLAPGGLLSLLVRNADALAMRPGTAGDFGAALAAFETDTYTNRLGLSVRADRLDVLRATLAGIAAPLHTWYGVRVFTDNVSNEAELPGPEELARVFDAEDRAGRTDPYRGVAALLHLCGVRG